MLAVLLLIAIVVWIVADHTEVMAELRKTREAGLNAEIATAHYRNGIIDSRE